MYRDVSDLYKSYDACQPTKEFATWSLAKLVLLQNVGAVH